MEELSFLSQKQRNIIDKPIEEDFIKISPDGFKYVVNSVVIEILNNAFNYTWNWEILDHGIQNGESNGKFTDPGSYAWVLGRLSYPVIDNNKNVVWAHKDAFGAKPVIGKAKVQSQLFKSAATDAFKKAASLVGIAKNIYTADDIYEAMVTNKIADDNWNKATMEIHKDALEKLKNYRTMLGDIVMNQKINNFCDETALYTVYGIISPSNVDQFLEYLENSLQNEQIKEVPKIFSNPFEGK